MPVGTFDFGHVCDSSVRLRRVVFDGVTPKEMVAIFQALKAAGALQAELELI